MYICIETILYMVIITTYRNIYYGKTYFYAIIKQRNKYQHVRY